MEFFKNIFKKKWEKIFKTLKSVTIEHSKFGRNARDFDIISEIRVFVNRKSGEYIIEIYNKYLTEEISIKDAKSLIDYDILSLIDSSLKIPMNEKLKLIQILLNLHHIQFQ